MTQQTSLPQASVAFGHKLAETVANQLAVFGNTLIEAARTEGRRANPSPYGTQWGPTFLLNTLKVVPADHDSNDLDFSLTLDQGNFVVDIASAHDKLRAEHNRGLAKPLRERARTEAFEAVVAMRQALVLLGGRTQFTIAVACKATMDTPMFTLAVDGHHVQRKDTPVLLPGLVKRLAPVFGGLHAVEQALKPTTRSDSVWGWEDSRLRVAAPAAVDAWFKSYILHDPTAPFSPGGRTYNFQDPVLYVDKDKVADGIADLRRTLCPQGSPYP
jgi:hypothetical protein